MRLTPIYSQKLFQKIIYSTIILIDDDVDDDDDDDDDDDVDEGDDNDNNINDNDVSEQVSDRLYNAQQPCALGEYRAVTSYETQITCKRGQCRLIFNTVFERDLENAYLIK